MEGRGAACCALSAGLRPARTKLPLSLLMLGVFTDDSAHALSLAVAPNDEAAIFTDRRARRSDFHGAGGGGIVVTEDCKGAAPLRPSGDSAGGGMVPVAEGCTRDAGENR